MNKKAYLIINIAFIGIAIFCLIQQAGFAIIERTNNYQFTDYLLMIFTTIAVYALKAIRLYIIIYGKGMTFNAHIKEFCKTVLVSIIVPFKLGEIFRAYCYSFKIKNALSGISCVIVDRFYDTIALLFLIGIFICLGKMQVTGLLVILLLFSLSIALAFTSFPALYSHWSRYFLAEKASKRTLSYLSFLKKLNTIYQESALLLQGKNLLLFIISIIAWVIEFGSVSLLSVVRGLSISGTVIEYLNAAMGLGYSQNHWLFVTLSTILLLITYMIMHILRAKE